MNVPFPASSNFFWTKNPLLDMSETPFLKDPDYVQQAKSG